MLVLTRKERESICIDGQITITVSQVRGGRVKLAIEAPRHIRIDREEVAAEDGPRPALSLRSPVSDRREARLVAAG